MKKLFFSKFWNLVLTFFCCVCLWFLFLYVPLFSIVYFSPFYLFNYEVRYGEVPSQNETLAIENLVGYFWHENSLSGVWNEKEKGHFLQVRDIYDFLFVLSIFMFGVLGFFSRRLKRQNWERILKWSFFATILVLCVLPVFSYFWYSVFHPIVFSDESWVIVPGEMSFVIFSDMFFARAVFFMVLVSGVLHTILYFLLRRFSRKKIGGV